MDQTEWVPSSDYNMGIFAHLGLTFPDSAPDRITGVLELGPQHMNRMGYVHGGVLCTMIDAGACCAGLYSPPGGPARYAVTLSLSVQFTRPVRRGVLRVEGKVVSAGRAIYTGEAHVYDAEGELVAHGIGTFSWRKGSRPEDMQSVEKS